MGLKFYFYILLISLSSASFACNSGKSSQKQIEVFLVDDSRVKSAGGEVFINDQSLNAESEQVLTTQESSEEISRRLADNSEIIVKYDGYGNKTETRYFKDHPRISTILIRTAPNGQKQSYAYGYGKEVKILDGTMSEMALTASADDLANAAGFYEQRSNEEITNFRKKAQPLQPLPSNNFPIQIPQNIPPQPEQNELDAAPQAEENSSAVDDSNNLATKNSKLNEEEQ